MKTQQVFAKLVLKNIVLTMVTVISRRKEIAFIEDVWDKE